MKEKGINHGKPEKIQKQHARFGSRNRIDLGNQKQNGIKTVFGRRIRKDAQSGLVVRMDKHPL